MSRQESVPRPRSVRSASWCRGRPVWALCLLAACATVEAPDPATQISSATTYDTAGRPTDGQALGSLVWGLGAGGTAWADEARSQDPVQDPDQARREREALIRTRFGSNVLIGPDGRVTKQYHLTGEAGPVFLNLVRPPEAPIDPEPPPPGSVLGGADDQSILGQMLGDRSVEITYVSNFDTLSGVRIRDMTEKGGLNPAVTGAPAGELDLGPSTSLLLVTGEPSALGGFEDALNLFYANMPQVEIEVQVVEYQTSDSLNFGVVPLLDDDGNPIPILQNADSRQLVQAFTQDFPLRAPLLGGAAVSEVGAFTLGGIHESWALNAQIQLLEANNVADIISSPKMVVRNGGLASIVTLTELPYPKAKITASGQNITSDIQFKPVGVTLNIRPVIAGTETIILQVFADVSAVTSFASTDPVDTPIVSSRMAVTTVHVPAGSSTVIGGLIQTSTFDAERKVPILGDIPLLGYLFRSTSSQSSKTELNFVITPRIIQGARNFMEAGVF